VVKAHAVRMSDVTEGEDTSPKSPSDDEEEYYTDDYAGGHYSEVDWEETAGEQTNPESDREYPLVRASAICVERTGHARGAGRPTKGEKPAIESNVARRLQRPASDQPDRNPANQRCVEVMVTIGGTEAKVLIDPGSTTDMVSTDFAKVAKLPPIELEEPLPLQLALTGSRSKINYGTRPEIEIGPIRQSRYFDITSLDGYDAILGTPFCWENGVSPIFEGDGYLLIKGSRFNPPRPSRPAITSRGRGRKGLHQGAQEGNGPEVNKAQFFRTL